MPTIGSTPDPSSSPIPFGDNAGVAGKPELKLTSKGQQVQESAITKTRAETAAQIKTKERQLGQADTAKRAVTDDVKRKIVAGEASKSSEVPDLSAPKMSSIGEGSRSWYATSSIGQFTAIMAPLLSIYKESKFAAGQASIEQGVELLKLAKDSAAKTRESYNKQAMEKFTEGMTQFMNAASSAYQAVSTASNVGAIGQKVDQQIEAQANDVWNKMHAPAPDAGGNVAGGLPAPAIPPRDLNIQAQTAAGLSATVDGEAGELRAARAQLKTMVDSKPRTLSEELTNSNQITQAKAQAFNGAISGFGAIVGGVLKGEIGSAEAEKQIIEGYRSALETFKQNYSKVESEQGDAIKGYFDFMSRMVDQMARAVQMRG